MNEKQAIQTNTKQDIEEYVTFVRLELYNQGLSCGAKAIRERLDKPYRVKPLPSVSTICRILSRRGLTHGRTGFYE
jgi:hypothetical protein